jgi:uncharacterized membrane protein
MIEKFLTHPLPNTLAVIVLLALIFSWIAALLLALRDETVSTDAGWYGWWILVASLLGLPGIFDLLQTKGVALFFALIASLVIVTNIVVQIIRLVGRSSNGLIRNWSKWAIPILVAGGLAVSGYFVYLELTSGTVTCGPAKGCDTVQNSPYARLFGIVPLGMLGFVGNIAILAGWLVWQYGPVGLRKPGSLAMWGFCVFGVAFSIYLTFLEPFVIGATCLWCITSAVIMMLLLLNSTPAAQQAFTIDEDEDDEDEDEEILSEGA